MVLERSSRTLIRVLFSALTFYVALSHYAYSDNGWPEGDQADIDKVEAFLNGIDTYRARFIQVDSGGGYSEGWLWLQRPRFLRVEYAPPNDLLLVADGTFLIFFDRDIDQVSQFQYEAGPFRFLLSDVIDFTEDMVVNAIERRAGLLRLKLIEEGGPEQGSVTLVFEEKPMRLVKWEVTDATNKITRVTLYEHSFGAPFERKLFRFTGYDRARWNYRYGDYE